MTTTQFKARPATQAVGTQAVGTKAVGTQAVGAQAGGDHRGLWPVLMDVAVPLGSYYLLRQAGCDVVVALALSSVVPGVHSVIDLVRSRKVNALATLIVTVNVVSIALSFWSGNARIMLAKDGAISSTIGIAILISVLAGRPLMTAGMRPFLVKGDAAKAAAFDRLKTTSPRFGRLERLFSAIWGIAFLADCVLRVILAFTLPVGTMVWLATVMTMASIAAGIVAGSFFSIPMETMVKREATMGPAAADDRTER